MVELPEEERELSGDGEAREAFAPVPMRQLHRLFGVDPSCTLWENEAKALEAVYRLCGEAGIPVSRRIRRLIERYCAAGARVFSVGGSAAAVSVSIGGESVEIREAFRTAMDYCVRQKLLPRIEGSSEAYRGRLVALRDALEALGLSRSVDRLERLIRDGDANMRYYHFFE